MLTYYWTQVYYFRNLTTRTTTMYLKGISAAVTGGSGGLGSAVARALHEAGATVVAIDQNASKLEDLRAELGDRLIPAEADVLDSAGLDAALDHAIAAGPLRLVVAAHGGSGVAERIVNKAGEPAPLENFAGTIQTYLTGTYNVVRLAAAKMATVAPDEHGSRGAIVTTASIAAYEGQIGQAAYSVAKGGVVSLTLAAARDLGALGIRVNCVAPGTMRTPIMESVGEEALEKFGAAVPFPRRLGQPAEFAALVRHLAENDYINGEVVRLDGAQRFGPR
ncbi:MAG: 3-hydroxy-2-methylbutyryl-CoA dehydrogenase [Aeromicrobium sp.]|jgi:NAD(P)-dependent dehydrogenase (short-subunit alcohol dehydrogenase family)|nr:3-hydroxy-2-methylbutyryl-CoA dehydrogenase [Aeromicrobium sp.]